MSRHWPIWIISLADATQRRAEIGRVLGSMGLDHSFIDAIDGRCGLPEDCERMVDRVRTLERDGTPMMDGEYACALSHQLAYARIIDEGLPGAIILEDDAILTRAFRDFYAGRGYERAPFIQMGYFQARIFRGPGQSVPGTRLHRLAENAFLTVGYSVSRAAAEHLRRHGLPIRAPADWPCDVTRIPAAVTMPRLVLHPDPAAMEAQSTLTSARGKKDISNYDPNRHFAKGMRRFVTPASWRRFIVKRISVVRSPGFAPAEDEVPWQPS